MPLGQCFYCERYPVKDEDKCPVCRSSAEPYPAPAADAPIVTFKIDLGADLADMWGGQTDFEVAVWMFYPAPDGTPGKKEAELIGAGHTVREAVADARESMRAWG